MHKVGTQYGKITVDNDLKRKCDYDEYYKQKCSE